MKQDWSEYKSRLKHYGYTQEEISAVEKIRTEYEFMTFEQFTFLFQQGVIKRTRKLRKPRNLFVCPEGKIWYLSHYDKAYRYCGYFKLEEDGE